MHGSVEVEACSWYCSKKNARIARDPQRYVHFRGAAHPGGGFSGKLKITRRGCCEYIRTRRYLPDN